MRIAIVDPERCRPRDCNRECVSFCPVVRAGQLIVRVDPDLGRAVIDESGCIGCNICVKKCPFRAIEIINLPEEPKAGCIHQYGPNMFRLYGLPVIKRGGVLGILGINGAGKTTAVNILAGRLRPNLGVLDREVGEEEIIRRFRGSELYNHFKALYGGRIRVSYKPQNILALSRLLRGRVGRILEAADETGNMGELAEELELKHLLDRRVSTLSGGELQRLAIGVVLARDADVYFFDEPSSHLDAYQRMRVARLIREMLKGKSVVVVEHDLAVLDYVADVVSVVYGVPKVFGVASKPYGVGAGINHFLRGYLPAENLRLRAEPIVFKLRSLGEERVEKGVEPVLEWTDMAKSLDGFELRMDGGRLLRGEVTGILGPNGIGKTTFLRLLVGELTPDSGSVYSLSGEVKMSYKPQVVRPVEGTVEQVLRSIDEERFGSGWYQSEVLNNLKVNLILDREVKRLSGGELQAVAVAAAVLRDADIYVFDEPSAFLDVEQRIAVAKVIRKLAEDMDRVVLVVDHDLIIHDFSASKIILFDGEPGVRGHGHKPTSLKKGINRFLRDLGVTFRRDPETGRPRVNKEGSWMDRYQKSIGEYYYLSTSLPRGAREAE